MTGLLVTIVIFSLIKGYIATDPDCPYVDKIYYVPNPTNCSEYFECNRGQKFVFSCPGELVWNSIGQYCDFKEYVDCSLLCPSLTETTKLPYPYDCAKYVQCSLGVQTILECPENFYYNPKTFECGYMDEIECSITTSTAISTSTTTTSSSTAASTSSNAPTHSSVCPSITEIVDIVYPYDCNQYYHCDNGQASLKKCPENFYFNPKTAKCDYMDNVDCTASSTITAPETTVTTTTTTAAPTTSVEPTTKDPMCPSVGTADLFYPYDCSKYYHCSNGQKIIEDCPENFYFSPTTGYCDYMDLVECTVTTSSTLSTSTRSTTTTPSTPSTSTPTTQEPSTTTDLSQSICKGMKDGSYVANPDDCRSFFECTGEIGQIFHCPASTVWDETILSCVYSQNDC